MPKRRRAHRYWHRVNGSVSHLLKPVLDHSFDTNNSSYNFEHFSLTLSMSRYTELVVKFIISSNKRNGSYVPCETPNSASGIPVNPRACEQEAHAIPARRWNYDDWVSKPEGLTGLTQPDT
jgi:hypothetical protein